MQGHKEQQWKLCIGSSSFTLHAFINAHNHTISIRLCSCAEQLCHLVTMCCRPADSANNLTTCVTTDVSWQGASPAASAAAALPGTCTKIIPRIVYKHRVGAQACQVTLSFGVEPHHSAHLADTNKIYTFTCVLKVKYWRLQLSCTSCTQATRFCPACYNYGLSNTPGHSQH